MNNDTAEELQSIIANNEGEKQPLTFGITKVRYNDRGGRMKLHFNLNKDQGTAYKNFRDAYKPDDISEQDFLVSLIINGMKYIQQEFLKHTIEYAKQNKEELAASGINFIENEDGTIKFIESEDSVSASETNNS